jgi:hypothetical protein
MGEERTFKLSSHIVMISEDGLSEWVSDMQTQGN